MSDVKQGVFISHVSEEQEAAHLLKFYLRRSLGEDLPVFVSSDYDSIAGGDIWFQTIIKGLNTAAVVIVLLSPASNDRRWINFEAGVGVGAGATVIPVVVHGQSRGDVGHPLTNLQIRSLDTIADTYALFADVAKRVDRLQRAMVDVEPMVKYCANVLEGSGWVGVDYQGAFLAIEGPIFKLKKIDDQTFIQAYSDALCKGGFRPHMANRFHMTPSVTAGHRKVYMTDKKTYYAEIRDYDAILMAKPGQHN